ncbi:MAG: ATP-binding protein [Spirochaetales bacterium]|nr:ATP-binding protein [Spirochaetales bacterium]
MHGIIPRKLLTALELKLTHIPVVAILGPRQCGKSTLADIYIRNKPDIIKLDLERPADLRKLDDPETFFRENMNSLICIDEIQRRPELFPVIRYLSDQNKRPGQFLILGSASKALIRQSSETLTGRISYLELTPFLWPEIQDKVNLSTYHNRGGYPRSILSVSDRLSLEWRMDFIQDFLERDIPFFSPRISPLVMSRLLQMICHSHGQLLNVNTFATSLGIDNKTVRKYIDLLEGAFVVRLLQPFYGNLKKRLIKSPKIYIRDTGLLHAVLQLADWNSLIGHPVYGYSWESLCMENIIGHLKRQVRFSFYRTSGGAEIDLILENGENKLAIEFKASSAPRLEQRFWTSLNDLNIKRAWVIAPLDAMYTAKGITFSPLIEFLNHPENRSFLNVT